MSFSKLRPAAPFLTLCIALAGCSSSDDSGSGSGDGDGTITPSGKPAGYQIGVGDGTPGSVNLTVIYEPEISRVGTDLEFHPERPNELWAINRPYFEGVLCTPEVRQGCPALEGRVAIIKNPGTPEQTSEVKIDPNSLHFMRRPPAMAFGVNDTFATCGEHQTGNIDGEAPDFIGPTLWSSDPEIFTVPGANGSHLDMLHATPFCMGIAHERDNIYWSFNGFIGAIDKYDFKEPHVPGGADHSDGEIYRYVEGEVRRLPEVPSHMKYDPRDGMLYIADTGNGRIAKLDTTSGVMGSQLSPLYELVAAANVVAAATITDFLPPGNMQAPSGIEIVGDVLFTTDNFTSFVFALDLKTGELLRALDTGLPPGTLAGIAIGPDDKLYLSDMHTSEVRRIDPIFPDDTAGE